MKIPVRKKAYFYLLIGDMLWGWAGPVVKHTLGYVTPIQFLFYRFWIVTALFTPFFWRDIRKHHPFPWRDIGLMLLIGLLGGPLCLWLIFAGTVYTTAIDAAVIVAMAPIFVIVTSRIFLKENVTRQEWLGVGIALLGTLITTFGPLFEGSLFAGKHLTGNLLVLASNIAWGFYVVAVKRFSKKYSAFVITALTFFAGALMMTPLLFAEGNGTTGFDGRAGWGIIYMAVFSSLIAYTAHNQGVAIIEASEATVFSYLQPIFAAPLAFFWLNEPLTGYFILGAIVITLGVIITERRTPLFSKY